MLAVVFLFVRPYYEVSDLSGRSNFDGAWEQNAEKNEEITRDWRKL
jgi:hypothetical protein